MINSQPKSEREKRLQAKFKAIVGGQKDAKPAKPPAPVLDRHAKQESAGRPARRAPVRGRADEKRFADQQLQYVLYTPDHPEVRNQERTPDEDLVLLLKEEINAAGITRRDLYAYIGEGEDALFQNENQVYNLEYGMRKRSTITHECARRWLKILGKELIFTTQYVEDGWLDSLRELREAVGGMIESGALNAENADLENLRRLLANSAEG